jgi:hypothetical protein
LGRCIGQAFAPFFFPPQAILTIQCPIGRNKVISTALKAMSPSASAQSSAYAKSQILYSIFDGRYKAGSPRTSVAPPVELFHPAFGYFLDDIKNILVDNIPHDIICETTSYMKATSAIYPSEVERCAVLQPLLSRILGVFIQSIVNRDKTSSDGTVEFSTTVGPAACLLEEDKNEFGDGHSDPSTQVGLSFTRFWAQGKVFFITVLRIPLA